MLRAVYALKKCGKDVRVAGATVVVDRELIGGASRFGDASVS
jgi:hypothetical protein